MAELTDLPEGPVTVMFTDVEGSTALRTTLGDAAADALFKQHDDLVREQIEAHRGQDLKAALGDGFLALFVSTRRALSCAIAIQQQLDRFNRARAGTPLRVRIGLNTGEVAWQNGQPSGEAIHAASRVCASASGGEVFVSDVTRQLAGTMPDVAFTDRGEFDLKGFPHPWRLWSLSWRSTATDATKDVFIGREAELAELRHRLRGALDGHGSLVLIGGEPGVGKTTLVRQLIKEAEQQGAVALFGRCYESDGTVPYSPFVETTEQALTLVPPEWILEDLGESASEVARMVPELRRRFPEIGPPLDLPPEQQRRYFFNAITEFITRGSERVPIVLVADDVHWADEPTLLLLEHVAAQLNGLHILAIGTYRDVELDVSRPLAATLERLVRARLAERISLKRFDRSSVARLLEAHANREPPAALVDAIYNETEGNAFFVDEVFRHLIEEGKVFDERGEFLPEIGVDELDVPESVRLVVGRRIERLGTDAQRVLAAGAVVGRGFEYALLERITDVDPGTLLDIVEEAERARVIVPEQRGGQIFYTFGHELIRQTLLASLSLPRRQRLHLAVADALEITDPGLVEARPSEVANHLQLAGVAADRGRTVMYLKRSAQRGLEAAAFEEAFRAADAGLTMIDATDELGRVELLEQLGWAERGLGRPLRCIELFAEAADGYARVGKNDAAARVLWENGYQQVWLGDFEAAFASYIRGLEIIGPEPVAERAALTASLGVLMAFGGLVEASEEQFDEALEILTRLGDKHELGRLHWGRCLAEWTTNRVNEGAESGRLAVELLRPTGDLWSLADALTWLSFPLVLVGRLVEASDAASEAVEIGTRIGHQTAVVLAQRGIFLADMLYSSSVDAMIEFATEDLQRFEEIGSPWLCQSYSFLAAAYTLRGDLDRGLAMAEAAIRTEPPSAWTGVGWGFKFVNRALASDVDECRRMLDEARPMLPIDRRSARAGASVSVLCAAEGCAILGWGDEAERLLATVIDLTNVAPMRMFDFASLLRIAGMAAGAAQRWDESEAHFEAALVESTTQPNVFDAPLLHHHFAEMLLRRGRAEDRPRALEMLTQAIDEFRSRDMPVYLASAEALLATL